jgi:hypothetical protein
METIRPTKVLFEPSKARSNRDLVMIVLGVFFIMLFLISGYASLGGGDAPRRPKMRGPVKDPKRLSLIYDSTGFPTKNPSDGLTGTSSPLPEGFV